MDKSTTIRADFEYPCYCCQCNGKSDTDYPCIICENNVSKDEYDVRLSDYFIPIKYII